MATPSSSATPTPSRCSSRRRPAIGPTRTWAPIPRRESRRRSIPPRARASTTLRAAHVRDYQQLFNRVTLDLGASKRVPTDERVRGFGEGDDPGLAALYFQYGRYLLIASSRPGSQPANLQGLWNESMSPPWGSKYTININTEMNYWPALSTNLAETMDPLTAMVSDLSVTGARTAREMYGAGGWVAHHNTDLWRATGPIDGPQYGHVADRRRVADAAALGSLRVHRRSRLPAAHLSAAQGRGAVLPRHARRGADAPLARHLAVAVAREPASVRHIADDRADDGRGRSCASCSATPSRRRALSASTPTCSSSGARRARGWRRCRSAAPASCRNGSTTGTCRRRRSTTGTCRTCSVCSPGTTSTCAARPSSRPP